LLRKRRIASHIDLCELKLCLGLRQLSLCLPQLLSSEPSLKGCS
jgi:hypothetical protein